MSITAYFIKLQQDIVFITVYSLSRTLSVFFFFLFLGRMTLPDFYAIN